MDLEYGDGEIPLENEDVSPGELRVVFLPPRELCTELTFFLSLLSVDDSDAFAFDRELNP